MRRNVLLILLGMMLLSISNGLLAADADPKGVMPGKWTMDLNAAKKLANEKKLPILLNFSGSDWCSWCKLMEKNVFSKQDWKGYAKDNILMVIIDFPKDSMIVPQEYVERNNELKDKYNVKGFPTFIVLDDDAETVLGRLGAGQEKTPASFIEELTKLSRYRTAEVARYSKTLKPKDRSAYLSIVDQISERNKAIKRHKQQISVAEQKIEELEQKVVDLKSSAQEFRAAQLGADDFKQYKKLSAELEEAKKEMADWISMNPQRIEENMKKYQAMKTNIQKLTTKLSKY
ncbi:MAG: thioredoxin family protein [Desulfobacteraceae bacterium]|nr:thioredoxin family protein [Desulfobacteraceae bacterium]